MNSQFLVRKKVEHFIADKRLLQKDKPVIVGLSGGADSMALLDILISLGYECIAAHCNFHLRGEESIRDHKFTIQKAKEYNIKYFSIDFQTEDYALEKGISIEMACRDLRYQWFSQLLLENDAQAIAIAHHRDDSIETFFLNLLRGTGISGLTGINVTNDKIVRPLSLLSRCEIEEYLRVNNIDYIIDSTNKEEIYQRNKIRLQLIPLLKEMNSSACDVIIRSIQNLQQTELIYKEALHEIKEGIMYEKGGSFYISIDKLKKTAAPQTILFELLKEFGVSRILNESIYSTLDGISGKIFYTDKYQIIKDRTTIIIKQFEEDLNQKYEIKDIFKIEKLPITITFEIQNLTDDFEISKEKSIAVFDYDKVQFPLNLRKWEMGDKFVPFGMQKMKKVSDYFSNRKFSLFQKKQIWLLCSGKNILWLIGERTDNRYRIDSKTTRVLIVKQIE